jgi:hypothetical protein
VGEEVDHKIARGGARADDAVRALQRLLRVATRYVLLKAIEHLLDIDPDITCPNRVFLSALQVLCALTPDILVVSHHRAFAQRL